MIQEIEDWGIESPLKYQYYQFFMKIGVGKPFEEFWSSTYRFVSCIEEKCDYIRMPSGPKCNDACSFTLNYSDSSHVEGKLAYDTFTFESRDIPTEFYDIAFGCADKFYSHFQGMSGIIGLGGGPLSLISQFSGFITYFTI
ncbi:hypothetical protein AMTRI_Chr02g222010 [Amborella trichopoda]